MLSEAPGDRDDLGEVQRQSLHLTPDRRLPLLPAFGLQKASQLPTPQSPSNLAAYAPLSNGTYSSPVQNMNRDVLTTQFPSATSLREGAPSHTAVSFMTPESSPIIPRKAMQPDPPVAGPSSTPHTPVRHVSEHADTSRAGSVADHSMVVDNNVTPLAPAPIITTPVSSRALTPASRLSSPFQGRLSAADTRTAKSQTKSPMPTDRPMTDVFATPSSSPPPLATPVPKRALGGEIQRIHLQLAADRAERLSEMEARRPEYLVREKRPRPDADIPTLDELDAADATLGVMDSPVKGRRLQLFQATSEETFEQSLLAGGYPGYGQSPAYKKGEPQTPVQNGKGRSALSQRALQWLQQATPGQPGPSTAATAAVTVEAASEAEPEWVPSEKETRKRKRLEAFKENPDRKESGSKLYPVEVEGRGRLLLNVPPEGTPAADTPVKKRVVKRRRRRGGRRGPADDVQEEEPVQPNWVDTAFPWCLRSQERTHAEKMQQQERLKWIERFLERESDSDSADEDQEIRPLLQSHENDQVAHRRGRGKMVPVRMNPAAAARAVREENVLVPSDPADARAALLSKRSVRSLTGRRKEGLDDEVDEVKCVGCERGDDGSELVQCDECQTWYHLPCIGIKHVSELGKEEDPWFCDKCLDIVPSSPLVEPMFVPTEDRLVSSASRRDSLFLQEPLGFESPAPHWHTELQEPQTPVRGGGNVQDGGLTRTFSTRSSWGDSSRAGPSTPESSARTVRVYNTPGPFALAFDREGFDPETPFDPTTTPSRGIKFSGGPPPTLGLSTPKGWTNRGGHTPTPAKFGSMTLGGGREAWRHGLDDAGPFSSPYTRSIYDARYDDTPVTHAPRVRERYTSLSVGGRRLWEDSPVAGFARMATPRTPPRGSAKMEREQDVVMETGA